MAADRTAECSHDLPRPPRGYLSCDAASNQCDPDRRQGEVEVAQQAAARAPGGPQPRHPPLPVQIGDVPATARAPHSAMSAARAAARPSASTAGCPIRPHATPRDAGPHECRRWSCCQCNCPDVGARLAVNRPRRRMLLWNGAAAWPSCPRGRSSPGWAIRVARWMTRRSGQLLHGGAGDERSPDGCVVLTSERGGPAGCRCSSIREFFGEQFDAGDLAVALPVSRSRSPGGCAGRASAERCGGGCRLRLRRRCGRGRGSTSARLRCPSLRSGR